MADANLDSVTGAPAYFQNRSFGKILVTLIPTFRSHPAEGDFLAYSLTGFTEPTNVMESLTGILIRIIHNKLRPLTGSPYFLTKNITLFACNYTTVRSVFFSSSLLSMSSPFWFLRILITLFETPVLFHYCTHL